MIKNYIIYIVVFFGLYLLSFNLHEFLLIKNDIPLPFSLEKVYQFHVGFSTLVCVNFLLFSSVDKIFPQLGFIYLGVLFLKIILFCIIFYSSIFRVEELSQTAKISLLIPALLFLLTEVIFVSKILIKKETIKIP